MGSPRYMKQSLTKEVALTDLVSGRELANSRLFDHRAECGAEPGLGYQC